MSLIIDLDGVIADFNSSFLKFVNKKLKKNIKKISDYHYSDFNISQEEVKKLIDEFHKSDYIINLKAFDYVNDFINLLNEIKINKNKKIYLVTARPYLIKDKTICWLEKNNLNIFDALFFTKNKFFFTKNLNAELIIDDYQGNLIPKKFYFKTYDSCITLSHPERTKKVLVDRYWNKNFNNEKYNIIRVNNPVDFLKEYYLK